MLQTNISMLNMRLKRGIKGHVSSEFQSVEFLISNRIVSPQINSDFLIKSMSECQNDIIYVRISKRYPLSATYEPKPSDPIPPPGPGQINLPILSFLYSPTILIMSQGKNKPPQLVNAF